VLMKTMRGRLTLTRGTASFQEVTYPAGKRTLRVDGTVQEGRLHLVVRLLPREDAEFRPGLGVVIEGEPQDQTFRLARPEDLLKPEPWRPFADEAERRQVARRLEDARRIRRGGR
ncbi:MAG: hypothetical protein KC656_31935, partial [Myxococcales bacterium]|nr:hypothetical protein [Myxococcales bacterium]